MTESSGRIQSKMWCPTHYKTPFLQITSFLICVLPCSALQNDPIFNPISNNDKLSFRLESSEFSIIFTATPKLIDDTISNGFLIQTAAASQFPKSPRVHEMIYKIIVKAQDCKSKYLLVSGSEKHSQRNILTSIKDFTGTLIGNTLGK